MTTGPGTNNVILSSARHASCFFFYHAFTIYRNQNKLLFQELILTYLLTYSMEQSPS